MERQVFQTASPNRWQRFKWSFRLLLFLFVCALATLAIALYKTDKEQDQIPLQGRAQKKVLTETNPLLFEGKLVKKFKGFRKYIDNKWKVGAGCGQQKAIHLSSNKLFNDSIGIRAAFYVSWDAQSFTSLQDNISNLNLVLPEWLFIDTASLTVQTRIDQKALRFIRSAGVSIMPMLTNNIGGKFNGKIIHQIITDDVKRRKLINDLDSILTVNRFAGVNIDFEDLAESSDETLINFQREVYQQLHSRQLLVTQDIIPFNEDYNFKYLSKYNDYLFLMAYDEHAEDGSAGPISGQKWIEAAADDILKDVPAEKIVLGLAGYGYDWKKGAAKATQLTYQEALTNARESEAKVEYDNDTYNLYYEYYDDNDVQHEVHFTDAATTFNTLRFATESGFAGTALWRLGSEDSRIWKFYNKPMNRSALKKFDFNTISDVKAGDKPDYIGEGEILDFLSTPKPGHIKLEVDTTDFLVSEENYDKLPSTYVIRKHGNVHQRKLVLSFDDGPDPLYTREILDTLAYYHVPANFFIVGIQAEANIPLVKRIYREGHEIGNHTFTHPNMAEVSKKRALLEMDATRLLIECITGHSTIMFRAPFNADSEPGKYEELVPVALSRTRNYITVGESIDPEDWEKGERPDFNADTIFNRVVRTYQSRVNTTDPDDTTGINGNIILLHDAGGDRSETVKAVGKIIRYFKDKGYTFTTVADLLGKKRNELMPAVLKGSGYYLIQFNAFLFQAAYILGNVMYGLFIFFLLASFIRISVLGFLAVRKNNKKTSSFCSLKNDPLVSIIVPAYNEEVNVVASLRNLLLCDYPNFDIVFVDDGSKDSTYRVVAETFADHPKMKLFTKPNGGKSSALNYGIAQTDAAFVVCIDADTRLKPDAVSKMMQHFNNSKVAAVAGNVKVGNEVNMLTKWQSIEYICSQNFDRKAFSSINAITVVPGAIGAFRKDVIEQVGGFTHDTLAEDCDLTFRILQAGYVIEDEPSAIALTEAPENVKQFMKQRFRWSFGIMQTFWKHRNLLFSSKHKALGWIALPDMLLFKYIIPFFSPLADVLMLLGLLSGNDEKIGVYYIVFLLVDAAIAAIAFSMEREKMKRLIWIIPQRLVYRWFILIVLFKSIRKAIKGELQHWGILKRTGNVKDVVMAQ